MKKAMQVSGIVGIMFLIGMLFISCGEKTTDIIIDNGTAGGILIHIQENVARFISPPISMVPKTYEITGVGTNSDTFSTIINDSNGGGTYSASNLYVGQWTINVSAKNADGKVVGSGMGITTVEANKTANVTISITTLDGKGTFSLGLQWPSGQVNDPKVISCLTPYQGEDTKLNFSIEKSNGKASLSTIEIPTGYYTLEVHLYDGDVYKGGVVEVIRIIKSELTTGTIQFSDLHIQKGSILVKIIVDMGEPLTISLSGAQAQKAKGDKVTLSASLAAGNTYTGNVVYTWYIDGNAKFIGKDFVFDNTWDDKQTYFIQAVGYSADGKHAGIASTKMYVKP